MSKYARYTFENPYLKEGEERKYSASEVMDEARERWRSGNWRATGESFEIERSQLTGREESDEDIPEALRPRDERSGKAVRDALSSAMESTQPQKPKKADSYRPSASRFELDINKDLMGDTISMQKLAELSYSPNYRPKGSLDEHLVTPMSTLQRYDVLAGDLEAPPEDLSFISDADHRLRREKKSGQKRDGTLRRDTRRLDTPLEQRRSQLISLLPSNEREEAVRIVKESNKRRDKINAELGKMPRREDELKKKNLHRPVRLKLDPEDPTDAFRMRRLGTSRTERLPEGAKLADSAPAPEFESETRHWSRITDDDPSWSEVMRHTESYVPNDMELEDDSFASHETHYIDDIDFDPERPFTPVRGYEPRERLRSDEAGQFNNEYLAKEGINTEKIKEIMAKKPRGRWIPPEYFADDQLVDEWFNNYNKGALDGEDFLDWAYRRRMMEEEEYRRQRAAERHAEEMRLREIEMRRMEEERRQMHLAQREAAVNARSSKRTDRREEARRRYEEAHRQGYLHGMELAEREEQERRRNERRSRRSRRENYGGMYPDLFDDDRYDSRRDGYDEPYDDRPRRRRW